MIALLCPTRGRPEQCKRMTRTASSTATNELLFMLGMQEDQKEIYSNDQINNFMICPDFSTVMTWNWLALEAKKLPEINLFMLAADDMIFTTPGWDEALINHYNALENKIHVYALQDSRDKDGTPHPIVTREWIEALGYAFPPIFLHWFVDTWTVAIAKANNCFTRFREFELIHDKPSDKGQTDETHNRIRRMGWHQRDKAVNDTCQHYLELEKLRLKFAMNDAIFKGFDFEFPQKIIKEVSL